VLDAVLIALGFALIWRDLAARRREQQMLLEQQTLLEQRVEQRTAELSELSLHLNTVREQEKAQLAREIHDEIGSTLVAAKIDVSSVRDRLKRIDESLSHRLTRALDAINDVIKVKRRIIEDLRPTLLDSLGIGAALRWQCQEFAARTGCRCDFSLYEEDLRLADPLSIVIYRVVQEALTNISKYAQATQVRVDITRDAYELVLKIVDNGIGIDPAAKNRATSHGLIGMRERVRQVGGVIEIQGTRGQGSVISARFPLPEEVAVAS
jgi:signal transduction histidine kinase